jgi:hypothetical protein
MASTADVEYAHREFSDQGQTLEITEVGKLESANGKMNFTFSDLDKNWWELTTGL